MTAFLSFLLLVGGALAGEIDQAEGSREPSRPNVLLIIADDLTTCLGSDGHRVCRTPHLDRLAREGVRFSNAYCQFPLCGPSRASMMSGLYPATNTVVGNAGTLGSYRAVAPHLADHPSMAGFLRGHGWFTARVSKIFHMGVPGGIEQGAVGGDDPDSWDYAWNVMGPETLSPGRRMLLSPKLRHYGSSFAAIAVPNELAATQTDALATSQAIAILESRAAQPIEGATNKRKLKPEAPFFLAVGLVRPHVPLVAPQRWFDAYPVGEMELPSFPADDLEDIPKPARSMANEQRYRMSEEQARQALAAYYASVSFMDEQVGRLLDTLDRLQLRKETVVIFTSDHGWSLGEHGCWQKLSLWDEVTRVPLLISGPGVAPGTTREELVELVDLYPTVAELCDLEQAIPIILQGTSLAALLKGVGAREGSTAYTQTTGQGHSLRKGKWRYSRWGDKGEELYDLDSDPSEFHNLAAQPSYASVLLELRAALEYYLTLSATEAK